MSALARPSPIPSLDAQAVFRARDGCAGAARHAQAARERARRRRRRCRPAAAAVALTLLDYETPVWLDAALARRAGRRAIGCASTPARRSRRRRTRLPSRSSPIRPARRPSTRFALGTPDYPDRSTTLVLQVEALVRRRAAAPDRAGHRRHAHVRGRAAAGRLRRRGSPPIARCFPRGVDLLFVDRRCASRRCRARRASSEEADRCMSRSRAARRRSPTRTGCSPMRGAAIRPCRS